jgi:hypothetical protein
VNRKYEKTIAEYTKCNESYLNGLAEAQTEMMAVAHHGLTQQQADIIVGYMAAIQTILQTNQRESVVPLSIRESNQTADFNG